MGAASEYPGSWDQAPNWDANLEGGGGLGSGRESRPPKMGRAERRSPGSESAELRGTCFPTASGDLRSGEKEGPRSVFAPHPQA